MLFKVDKYHEGEINEEKILEIFQGWNAYANWANTLRLRRNIVKKIYSKSLIKKTARNVCLFPGQFSNSLSSSFLNLPALSEREKTIPAC